MLSCSDDQDDEPPEGSVEDDEEQDQYEDDYGSEDENIDPMNPEESINEQENAIDTPVLTDLHRLRKRPYLVKTDIPQPEFAKINKFLLKPRDEISFHAVSKQLGISDKAVKLWYEAVHNDQQYSPDRALSHKAMSIPLEETILHTVEENYLKNGYFFNNRMLKNIALRAWGLAAKKDKLKPSFCASDTWCNDFRRRHDYVLRKAHLERRPKQDEKFQRLAGKYQAEIRKLFKEHTKSNSLYLVANMDETSWKVAYPGELTWAKKGSD
jgi:hypothetical protein